MHLRRGPFDHEVGGYPRTGLPSPAPAFDQHEKDQFEREPLIYV
jgi:hypothetical protein